MDLIHGRRWLLGLLGGVLLSGAPISALAQAPPQAAAASLTVAGGTGTSRVFGVADLKALPRTRVEVKTPAGAIIVYEGVLAGELLKRVNATIGPGMRGTDVASYVVATGSDGYQAVFALPEVDQEFVPSSILVADTADGRPLTDAQGPFRIVAPKDLRGTRAVRMLVRLEVVKVQK